MAAGDGLVSMTPTSIAHSGTSASINADGGVDFTAVTSLSLNGVFTSDYDNYLVVLGWKGSTSVTGYMRWRVSGTDDTASNYTNQRITASGTSETGERETISAFMLSSGVSTLHNGDVVHVYGPALAQPTAARVVTADATSDARIRDVAGTHSLSTAYDGFTLTTTTANTMTGVIHVFGYEE